MLGFRKEAEDLYEVIEDFRQHIRLHQFDHPGRDSHSAFATGGSSSPTFRGQPPPGSTSKTPKPCICGDTHWLSECHYLVPDRRPKRWNANSDQQKKVNDQLLNPQTKAWVDRTLQKQRD